MKTNIFKIAILALAISVSFSSCTKGDEPTPSNPNPVVNPPTYVDFTKVDSVLTGSIWKMEYVDIYINKIVIDTIQYISFTQAKNISNNNSIESIEYNINDSTFFLSKTSYNISFISQYKLINKVTDSTYIFSSGPAMGDKNVSTIGVWNVTFTKIN